MSDEWHYLDSKQQTHGPVSADQIQTLSAKQNISVWKEGMQDWVPAHTLPEFKNRRLLNFLAPQKEPKIPAQPMQPAQPSLPMNTSKVGNDVEITGTINFKGDLIIEGKFKGQSIEGGNLIVGEHAEIRAKNITVGNLTSSALVDGDAEVSERCYLKATAHFQGDLKTFRLAMDDGATFSGGLLISKPANIVLVERQEKAG